LAKATAEAMTKPENEMLRFVEDLKRQWMSTIDALVDPLMIVGRDYKIRKANLALARMAGVDVRKVVGMKCHEAFAGRKTPCPGCAMRKAADLGENVMIDLEHVRADSYFEVNSHPLKTEDGKVETIVQVYRDRTEQHKMQEQLSQQDKLASIGLLAGGVAHEINNPLGGILIFSQMLLREMDKASSHYADVVEIEAATQRCKAIVESLLDFARQNPAGKKPVLQEINAVDAIRTAVRFGKVSIRRGGTVEIEERYGEEAHFLRCDRNKIIQVFLNLIQNAIQAMPDGGDLIIRAKSKRRGDQVVGIYEVKDSGVGIPPEHVKKIFDPFFTTKDPGEGTGLGLALCYGFIQDVGGNITVESTLNVGTTFTVELPLDRIERQLEQAS
jgi:two-component system NtrC family sensor kinase